MQSKSIVTKNHLLRLIFQVPVQEPCNCFMGYITYNNIVYYEIMALKTHFSGEFQKIGYNDL